MNKKQKKELIDILTDFPKGLDQAVIDNFGKATKCKTEFSILSLSYQTQFKATGEKKKRIDAFIAGYMKGHCDIVNIIEIFRQKYFNN